MNNSLAVIIPAYKANFFYKALESLTKQTDKRFNVYIGDDCSPDNLLEIVDFFRDKLIITYCRFANNIGGKHLVKQWERCIALSKGEEWLWLFSDDDIMDETCVEKFYQHKNANYDVYRFNTVGIDSNDKIKFHSPTGPQVENSFDMAFYLLLGERGNSMPDHIFSRAIYLKKGGLVDTPFAQGADWATSILFSSEKGLYVIPDAFLFWRYSGLNISSTAFKNKGEMMKGHLVFIEWILNHFEYLKEDKNEENYNKIVYSAIKNIENVFIKHFKGIDFSFFIKIIYFLHSKLGLSWTESCRLTLYINKCCARGSFISKVLILLGLKRSY